MFDNVNEVEFHAKDYDKILAVISQEGEKVPVSTELRKKNNSLEKTYIP